MSSYKIHINDRNYSSWSVCNASTLETETISEFNPSMHKLFSNDVFTYDKGIVNVIHSSTRINEYIPAVLILADNKTYGREHNKHSAGHTFSKNSVLKKLLYKKVS